MGKNIKLDGKEYNGISTVQLPTTEGGIASFKDVDEITTSESDVVDYAQFATGISFGSNLPKVVKLNIPQVTSLNSAFNKSLHIEELEITSQSLTNLSRMLYGGVYANLKKITMNIDFSKVTLFTNAFSQLKHTDSNGHGDVEIIGDIDFSSATNVTAIFQGGVGIKEVRFAANTLRMSLDLSESQHLSNESIQSIINSLVDLTGETSQTLKLHSDVKAKLAEEQTVSITAKNWTLA